MKRKELEFLCAFAECNALENEEFLKVLDEYHAFMEYVEWVCKGNAYACNTDENDEFWEFVDKYLQDYKTVKEAGFLGECAKLHYGNPTLTIIEWDL